MAYDVEPAGYTGRGHSKYAETASQSAAPAPGTLSALFDHADRLLSRLNDVRAHTANIRERLSGPWPPSSPPGPTALKPSPVGRLNALEEHMDEGLSIVGAIVDNLEAISLAIT